MSSEMIPNQGFLAIGVIVGAHGIRGEVKVSPLTDYPERFRSGARVYLGTPQDATPTIIEAARPHKHYILVKLAAVPDRNAAELLRDQYLLIPEEQAMPLGAHENYTHDLIGLAVQNSAGERLGELVEVIFTGANDVYVVTGPEGELLLPALQSVVLEVDLVRRLMTVEPPKGLSASRTWTHE